MMQQSAEGGQAVGALERVLVASWVQGERVELRRQIESLHTLNASLEQQNAQLQGTLERVRGRAAEELQTMKNKAQWKIKELKDHTRDVEAENSAMQQEVAQSRAEMQRLQEELLRKDGEMQIVKEDCAMQLAQANARTQISVRESEQRVRQVHHDYAQVIEQQEHKLAEARLLLHYYEQLHGQVDGQPTQPQPQSLPPVPPPQHHYPPPQPQQQYHHHQPQQYHHQQQQQQQQEAPPINPAIQTDRFGEPFPLAASRHQLDANGHVQDAFVDDDGIAPMGGDQEEDDETGLGALAAAREAAAAGAAPPPPMSPSEAASVLGSEFSQLSKHVKRLIHQNTKLASRLRFLQDVNRKLLSRLGKRRSREAADASAAAVATNAASVAAAEDEAHKAQDLETMIQIIDKQEEIERILSSEVQRLTAVVAIQRGIIQRWAPHMVHSAEAATAQVKQQQQQRQQQQQQQQPGGRARARPSSGGTTVTTTTTTSAGSDDGWNDADLDTPKHARQSKQHDRPRRLHQNRHHQPDHASSRRSDRRSAHKQNRDRFSISDGDDDDGASLRDDFEIDEDAKAHLDSRPDPWTRDDRRSRHQHHQQQQHHHHHQQHHHHHQQHQQHRHRNQHQHHTTAHDRRSPEDISPLSPSGAARDSWMDSTYPDGTAATASASSRRHGRDSDLDWASFGVTSDSGAAAVAGPDEVDNTFTTASTGQLGSPSRATARDPAHHIRVPPGAGAAADVSTGLYHNPNALSTAALAETLANALESRSASTRTHPLG